MLKGIIVCGLIAFSSLFAFIVYIINRERGEKRNKDAFGITYYAEDYLQKKQEAVDENERLTQEVNSEGSTNNVKEKSAGSKKLLERIMQLNELKDSGQITEVEYTKLRQKAIRKYKG